MAKQPFLDDPLVSAAGTATQFFDPAGKIESLADVVIGPITLGVGGAISGISDFAATAGSMGGISFDAVSGITGSGAGGSVGDMVMDNVTVGNVSFTDMTDGATTINSFATSVSTATDAIPTSGAVKTYVDNAIPSLAAYATTTEVNNAIADFMTTTEVNDAIAAAIASHLASEHAP